mmetsp:Transcript_8779/g.20533  ORF Transcript_8779/g.20533 Transcript_8779/m.20533 type:complete len:228 (-) Transcript_8779:312-995(-)
MLEALLTLTCWQKWQYLLCAAPDSSAGLGGVPARPETETGEAVDLLLCAASSSEDDSLSCFLVLAPDEAGMATREGAALRVLHCFALANEPADTLVDADTRTEGSFLTGAGALGSCPPGMIDWIGGRVTLSEGDWSATGGGGVQVLSVDCMRDIRACAAMLSLKLQCRLLGDSAGLSGSGLRFAEMSWPSAVMGASLSMRGLKTDFSAGLYVSIERQKANRSVGEIL